MIQRQFPAKRRFIGSQEISFKEFLLLTPYLSLYLFFTAICSNKKNVT